MKLLLLLNLGLAAGMTFAPPDRTCADTEYCCPETAASETAPC